MSWFWQFLYSTEGIASLRYWYIEPGPLLIWHRSHMDLTYISDFPSDTYTIKSSTKIWYENMICMSDMQRTRPNALTLLLFRMYKRNLATELGGLNYLLINWHSNSISRSSANFKDIDQSALRIRWEQVDPWLTHSCWHATDRATQWIITINQPTSLLPRIGQHLYSFFKSLFRISWQFSSS